MHLCTLVGGTCTRGGTRTLGSGTCILDSGTCTLGRSICTPDGGTCTHGGPARTEPYCSLARPHRGEATDKTFSTQWWCLPRVGPLPLPAAARTRHRTRLPERQHPCSDCWREAEKTASLGRLSQRCRADGRPPGWAGGPRGAGADECRTHPVLCTLLLYVLIHWICDSDSSNLYSGIQDHKSSVSCRFPPVDILTVRHVIWMGFGMKVSTKFEIVPNSAFQNREKSTIPGQWLEHLV